MPEDWLTAFKETLPDGYANQANPFVERVPECRDAIGDVIVKGILGEDVEPAAKEAQKKLEELILGK